MRAGLFAWALAMLAFGAGVQQGTSVPQPGRFAGVPLGLDTFVPSPVDNPGTSEKVVLGERLFHDPRLSRDRTVSCSSCHVAERGFTDGRPVAVGVEGRRGTRNAPTLVNRAYGKLQFWDGRASSIEEQILATLQSEAEMDMPLPELEKRVAADTAYREAFGASFTDGATAANVARAIAAYVRTILAGDAPFDRYLFGDTAALTGRARQGMDLFFGEANCWRCHAGPNFSDEKLHNTGVPWIAGPQGGDGSVGPTDLGRFNATTDPDDRGRFKTPTLRQLASTAPYMHDGSFSTLVDVIEFYDRGGEPNAGLDAVLRPLELTSEDKAALLSFLEALDGAIQHGRD